MVAKTHKRMDWLINEFAGLNPDRYFLWIVGQKESESAEVISLASRTLKNENYKFDTLSYQDMSKAYQASNIFVLCSLNEGFGRVYIEAMSAGLPVIAHSNPNTIYIVGESRGLIDMQKAGAISEVIDLFCF